MWGRALRTECPRDRTVHSYYELEKYERFRVVYAPFRIGCEKVGIKIGEVIIGH